MKKEIRIFFTALMFLTRLPVPKFTDHSQEYLEKSLKYSPLVGWIVGAISGLVYLVFNKYISNDIGILASMITGILVTGALHEDGFADACDAFGGGWTKERILLIMKDSRLGTFGVIGLISILSAKFLLLKELPQFTPNLDHPTSNIFYNYCYFLLLLVGAHSVSRLMPMLVVRFFTYATDPDNSKSKPMVSKKPTSIQILIALIFAVGPLFFLDWIYFLVLVPCLLIALRLGAYFKKWIGGYTGDCLGAVQQVSELVYYLSVIIIWKFF